MPRSTCARTTPRWRRTSSSKLPVPGACCAQSPSFPLGRLGAPRLPARQAVQLRGHYKQLVCQADAAASIHLLSAYNKRSSL